MYQQSKFWQIDGVYTTAVGYAGSFTPNPTYKEVCSGRTGHTEAVLVVRHTVSDGELLGRRRGRSPSEGAGGQVASGRGWIRHFGQYAPDSDGAGGSSRRIFLDLGQRA